MLLAKEAGVRKRTVNLAQQKPVNLKCPVRRVARIKTAQRFERELGQWSYLVPHPMALTLNAVQ
jgi:hypothetical protein